LKKRRFRVPHHLTKRGIDLHESIVISHQRHSERPFFEHSPETLFTLTQGFICSLQFGDFDARSDVAGEFSVAVERGAFIEEPSILTVRTSEPVLHLKTAPGVERGSIRSEAAIKIIGMHAGGPAVPQFLGERTAGELEPRFIDESTEPIDAGQPDHDGR